MSKQKCKCGMPFFCSKCSKIMVVIGLKDEHKAEHGKNTLTRYSSLKDDKRPGKSITKLKERVLEKELAGQFNVAKFYDNETAGFNLKETTPLEIVTK